MFSVEKILADGKHDKFKSRMVMNENKQDVELFPDRSFPTVVIHSSLMCLTLDSRDYKIAKIDVKGAFIQTEMEGPLVYISCNKQLAG